MFNNNNTSMFDTGSKYQQLGKIDNLISADSWSKIK